MICRIDQPSISYTYSYASDTDNLTGEVRTGGSYAGTVTYVYDTLGQLTRVNDPKDTRGGSTGTTWVYTYDRGGNILNKKRYAYTTGTVGTVQQTIAYTYGDTNWKDKLTAYNGSTLTYDNMGNVTNDGTWTYAWAAGRQLSGMSKSGTEVEFDYDHNGLRVKKKVGTTETNYTLNGKLVVHLTKGSDWMHFYYDAQGRPAMVNFNGTKYHYLHNLQGDIIGIVDASGTIVVEYKYDAWGKIIARTGSLVSTLGYLNPFRYRDYVYDEETGLYYLRSRYYNPEWGRFINADVLLGKRGALLSHNLFAYCYNNPSVLIDIDGQFPSFPEGSFRFDWAGMKILWWYLFGRGEKREINSSAWSNYMKKAKTCAGSCCGSKESTTLSEYTYSLLRPHAEGIVEGETRTVELRERVSLQNGESIYGYNYLHGVNGDAGGYIVSATITRYCGYITYDVTCTWNDIMDPNFTYSSDKQKAEFAKSIPFASPADYTIAITWNDTFIENVGGISVPQY